VILDGHKLRKSGLLPEGHEMLGFMGKPVFVELFAYASQGEASVGELMSRPRLPMDVMFDNAFFYGEFEIFAHEKIDSSQLDFPMSFHVSPARTYLQWGFIEICSGEQSVMNELGKLRAPFNITTLSLKAAIEALKDEEFVKMTLETNFEEIKKYEKFADKHAIKRLPSFTNFIVFEFERQNASELAQNLLKKGIILRDLKGYGLNAIRITIGLPNQNDVVLKQIEENLK